MKKILTILFVSFISVCALSQKTEKPFNSYMIAGQVKIIENKYEEAVTAYENAKRVAETTEQEKAAEKKIKECNAAIEKIKAEKRAAEEKAKEEKRQKEAAARKATKSSRKKAESAPMAVEPVPETEVPVAESTPVPVPLPYESAESEVVVAEDKALPVEFSSLLLKNIDSTGTTIGDNINEDLVAEQVLWLDFRVQYERDLDSDVTVWIDVKEILPDGSVFYLGEEDTKSGYTYSKEITFDRKIGWIEVFTIGDDEGECFASGEYALELWYNDRLLKRFEFVLK